MISEFTDCIEFKRLIEEQYIKPERVKAFLKSKGIILLNSNPGDLAFAAYTLFFGSEDMSCLQELIHIDKNYQKSTMLLIEPKHDNQTQEELKDVVVDEINRFRNISTKDYCLENVQYTDEGNVAITFTYEKRVAGKMKLLNKVRKTLNVYIDKVPNTKKLVVDIRRTDSSDAKEFFSFLESIKKTGDTENDDLFLFNHVSLDRLIQKNKVEFFDAIAKNKFKDWKFETITGITVKKFNFDSEDDEYEAETDVTGTLAGITSAILKGNALRTNEFVQTCLKENFVITSMKFKYSNRREAVSTVIDINFKNTDIRIDIERSYVTGDDGKEYISPMLSSLQNAVIKDFQNAAYMIYNKLIEAQRTKAKEIKTVSVDLTEDQIAATVQPVK